MTFSRLTLGEPRLKSKLRGGSVATAAPCDEPLVYGTNILRDPLFSGRPDFVDRGPVNQDFSAGGAQGGFSSLTRSFWASSPGGATTRPTDPDYWQVSGWDTYDDYNAYNQTTSLANHDQFLSTANPHAGTYHYRLTWSPVSGDTASVPGTLGLQVIGVYVCADTDTPPMTASCRIEPGDFIGFSIWWSISQPSIWAGDIFLNFYDLNGDHLSGTSVVQSYNKSATGYIEMSVDAVAPASSYFATANTVVWADDNTNPQYDGVAVDFSDAALEIQP